jgi:hypothetical protein
MVKEKRQHKTSYVQLNTTQKKKTHWAKQTTLKTELNSGALEGYVVPTLKWDKGVFGFMDTCVTSRLILQEL